MAYVSTTRVKATLDAHSQHIWARPELLQFLNAYLQSWLTKKDAPDAVGIRSKTPTAVLEALTDAGALEQVTLDFPYRSVTRYLTGEATTYSIIQSTDDKGYFSHYSAIHIHGLTEQIPKSIYFNVEQPAAGGGGSLTQNAIDRAFKGKCRTTNNVIEFRDTTINKINGQNTGRLGVEDLTLDDGSKVQVTNIERTLIDIAVRPVYSGGIAEVAKAYKLAAPNVSGNRVATYLKSLNYTYPYHQVIGFYMSRAGNYSDSQMAKIKAIPVDFNFYINYQIKNPVLNTEWKLYIPKGF